MSIDDSCSRSMESILAEIDRVGVADGDIDQNLDDCMLAGRIEPDEVVAQGASLTMGKAPKYPIRLFLAATRAGVIARNFTEIGDG